MSVDGYTLRGRFVPLREVPEIPESYFLHQGNATRRKKSITNNKNTPTITNVIKAFPKRKGWEKFQKRLLRRKEKFDLSLDHDSDTEDDTKPTSKKKKKSKPDTQPPQGKKMIGDKKVASIDENHDAEMNGVKKKKKKKNKKKKKEREETNKHEDAIQKVNDRNEFPFPSTQKFKRGIKVKIHHTITKVKNALKKKTDAKTRTSSEIQFRFPFPATRFETLESIPWFEAQIRAPFATNKSMLFDQSTFMERVVSNDDLTPSVKHSCTQNHNTVETVTNTNVNSNSSKKKLLLPHSWYSIPSHVMNQLNQEILAFACYVTLTSEEIAARQYIIQSIQTVAQMNFGSDDSNATRDKNNPGVSKGKAITAQLFGSFASPHVCTFLSDIDIALWGVVDIPLQEQELLPQQKYQQGTVHFVDSNEEEEDTGEELKKKNCSARSNPGEETLQPNELKLNQTDDKEQRKKEKIEKWRQVLIEADRLSQLSPTAIEAANVLVTKPHRDVHTGSNDDHMIDDAHFIGESKTYNRITEHDVISIHDSDSVASRLPRTEATKQYNTRIVEKKRKRVVKEEDETASNYSNASSIHDGDSADPMNRYENRWIMKKKSVSLLDDASYQVTIESFASVSANTSMICLNSLSKENHSIAASSTRSKCKDEENLTFETKKDRKTENLDISFSSAVQYKRPHIGPTGKTKRTVIRALSRLGYHLRKFSPAINSLEVRKYAKVPIVNFTTRFGFEGDVLIGGQSGQDTSEYASSQVRRFKSFSSVVLVLKILLQQADLDVPFKGGIGSFKLYVLVAYHVENHIALGGVDSPAEILVSFLFRYGNSFAGIESINKDVFTRLKNLSSISSDGGVADLQSVFKMNLCTALFSQSFTRLLSRATLQKDNANLSWLGSIIDSIRLKAQRSEFLLKASCLKNVQARTLSRVNVDRSSDCNFTLGKRIHEINENFRGRKRFKN